MQVISKASIISANGEHDDFIATIGRDFQVNVNFRNIAIALIHPGDGNGQAPSMMSVIA